MLNLKIQQKKIIIGEQDRDGNINPNTIRFVLKIGTEYKFKDLSFVSNKKTRIKWINVKIVNIYLKIY